MSEALETIMELREEFMVSPVGDSKPTLRTAHFLKPCVTSINGRVSGIPPCSMSSLLPTSEPKTWPLTIQFNGWRCPPKKWIQWVDTLHSTYESVWRKVGIYDAIMSTKSDLVKNEELVFGISERWCSETNTFVFPWSEATITLEDIMVLGGYPVLGASVFSPLETQELKDIEENLSLARKETSRSKRNKASIHAWMNLFINRGREIEHEAFLAAWLSLFVFPENNLIRKVLFPIAIHLARGNPIALAPAVLASIYKDLTLLKQTIVDFTKSPVGDKENLELVVLRSPFYFVQIWVWERIEALQPKPKLINNGDPVLARWHKVRALKIDNVRLVLDSAKEEFLWRPYTKFAGKRRIFYAEKSMWVTPDHTLDKEIVSFAICLRASELVGLDCIKQYLPHRVALQFGMDQDLPGCVPRLNETPDIAWGNYSRPIRDRNLYIPSRLFEADVTTRYAEWWKQSVLGRQDPVKNIVQGKRSPRSSKAKKRGNDADVPPGFPTKCSKAVILGNSCEDGSTTKKGDNDADVPFGFLLKRFKTVISRDSVEKGSKAMRDNNADVPPGFPPKITHCAGNSVKECRPTLLEDIKCGSMSYCLGKITTPECKHLFNQSQSSSTADYGTVGKADTLMKSVATVKSETSMGGLEEAIEDANGSKELSLAYDRVNLSWTEGEGSSYTFDMKVTDLENRISRLERVIAEFKIARFGHSFKN